MACIRRFATAILSCETELALGTIRVNCHGAPVVQKIVRQVGAEATDIRTRSKAHGVSIDISAAVT